MLRLGAWLAQKLRADEIDAKVVRQTYEAHVASSGDEDQLSKRYKDLLAQDEKALAANAKFYTDLVVRVGDDYDGSILTNQLKILTTELSSAGVTELSPYAEVFLKHIAQYATDKTVRTEAWLKDLENIPEK